MTRKDTQSEHDRDARDLRICEMLDVGYSYAEIKAETGATTWQGRSEPMEKQHDSQT